MEFKVLGPLEVRRNGQALVVAGGKPRAVLAMLLLHANEPVSAERLAVALWGEDAPAGAARTVQVYVSRLRKALGEEELLVSTPAGYRLRVRSDELDADRFERLLERGQGLLADGRAQEAAGLLREALGLWRGPALADLAFEPFAPREIARLEELRLAAVEARIDADLATGRHRELVPELQRLVAEHPLRERLHAQLMLALYRAGRQADALGVYRHAREVLVEQLGIEPGAELRRLEQAILAHDLQLSLDAPVAVEAADAAGRRVPEAGGRVRIPVAPSPTVGREADLGRLRAVIGDPAAHLVTLVGPPGVGKTRLAIEAAWAVASQLRDGAVFVSLAALDAFQHVGSTIARELDVNPLPGESVADGLIRDLGGRQLLLVLDNFEHLLEAAPLVAELLAAAPELTVLATSREPLRLRAERLFPVDPLAVPAQTDMEWAAQAPEPAVELFTTVAQARDPGFAVTRDNWPAVAETCRRLDGLPLAIELAAGRIGLLSIAEVAARLRIGLEAVGTAPRDAPTRQRTLEATLEWSYTLLAAAEQQALLSLAVFAGGCTLDAAEAVTAAPLEALQALVDKNLVRAQASAGATRLVMLETVRQFAHVRLSHRPENESVHRRHCEYYLALAEQAQPKLERSASPALLTELDAELENCRAGLRWSSENAAVLALRLASALTPYWNLRALKPEAAGWLDATLERDAEAVPTSVRADALAALAFHLAEPGGASERAETAACESLELRRSEGDTSGCARSTNILAVVHRHANRADEAYRCAREAERLALKAGDDQALVWARAEMAMSAPTLKEALARGEQAAAAYRGAGNERDLAGLQTGLAYAALGHGDHATALRLSLEALDAARALGDPYVLALAHGNAALAALFTGQLDRAEQGFVEELRLMGGHKYDMFRFEALNGLAAVAASQGRDQIAATLAGAGDAMSVERHQPGIARDLEQRFFAPARARLGEPSWQAAYAAGATLDREQAIDTALRSVKLRAVA